MSSPTHDEMIRHLVPRTDADIEDGPMHDAALDHAMEMVGRARKAQEAMDALGVGRSTSGGAARYTPTGMRATISLDVAVVRAVKPRKCGSCGRRRVVFALTITDAPFGNPEHPWRCAPCSGLREGRP